MRLARVRSHSELSSILVNTTGAFVLTNARFEDAPLETIRLNVTPGKCSYTRGTCERGSFSLDSLPFEVANPSLLMSLDQLRQWRDNCALVHDSIGSEPLGDVSVNNPVNTAILSQLQAASSEIDSTDALIESHDLETALFRMVQQKRRSHELFANGHLTSTGSDLLQAFQESAETYSRLPELRAYSSDRSARRVDDLGPRGQRFRAWLADNPLACGGGQSLRYVDDELKPLHLSGRGFRWRNDLGDLRLLSVDLLCEHTGKPVWCEVKMQGDTWTTSALVQILLYGSMLAAPAQQRRLERQFPTRFADARPWLGILVEERDHPEFPADHAGALGFCRHPDTRARVGPFFDGIHVAMIASRGEGWQVTNADTIHWHEG